MQVDPTTIFYPRCAGKARAALKWLLGLWIAILLLQLCVFAQPVPTKKVVLILTGADPNNPGFSVLTQAITSKVRKEASERVEFVYEIQDTFLSPPVDLGDDDKAVAYLTQKYRDKKIDLVLALVAPRFKDLLIKDPALFHGTPKVFYDFEDRRESILKVAGTKVTGVWANFDVTKTLDIALQLQPDAKRVVVTAGSSAEDQKTLDEAKAAFRPFEARLPFTYLTNITLEELRYQLSRMPRDTVVIFLLFSSDPPGSRYTGPEAIMAVAPTSGAPIFGMSDRYLGSGIVGGSLIDFVSIGEQLGNVSLRILSGEAADSIPSQTVPSVAMFDSRELRRWGISEDSLPVGSIVQFSEPTLWDAYKWYLTGLLAAIVIETLLIGWLLLVRSRRRQAEAENTLLHTRLDEIVSNVPGIVWETRTDPAIGRRRTTYISEYVQRMLGYSPEEWLQEAPGFGLTIVQEEDRDRAMRESEAIVDSGDEGVSEFRWVTRDGRIRWVENHLSPVFGPGGKVIGLRGVALDVTDRKLAEEQARETEKKDRAILAAIPDLMFLQTLDGVYLDYHSARSNDLLVAPESFLGKNMREVLPPSLAEQFAECFANAREGGEPQILEYSLDVGRGESSYEARMVRAGDTILSIVRDITNLKRSEQEALELSGRLITAQEDERSRVARELHDGVMQELALLSIDLDIFGAGAPNDPVWGEGKTKELSSRVAGICGEIHRLSHELHPAILEQLGLVTAVRAICTEVDAAHDVGIVFKPINVPKLMPKDLSLSLYRIVQESLQNVVKHSAAAHVEVQLWTDDERLMLRVSDDGCGFDPGTVGGQASLGLIGMRERIRLLNGDFSVTSSVGSGTLIEAVLPLKT